MNNATDDQILFKKQKRFDYLYCLFMIILVVVGDAIMLWLLRDIALRIQHRHHPLAPPVPGLLFVFYLMGATGLLGSVLWTRSLERRAASLPPGEFTRQTQIGFAMSLISFVVAPLWVFRGGALSQSAPLLVAQAAVTLLCVLPSVRRYGASIR